VQQLTMDDFTSLLMKYQIKGRIEDLTIKHFC